MDHQGWFYELLGEEFGPVSVEQIGSLVDDGTLSSTDRVRPANSDNWIAVADMPHTLDSGDDAGELSDLSELSFTFEGEDSEASDDRLNELDIDSFHVEGRSEESDDSSDIDDLGIDAFRIEGDSDSPSPRRRHVVEEETETADYYAESFGQVLGPMPLRELLSMTESGALSSSDRVRQGEQADWTSPLEIEEVAAILMTQGHDDEDDQSSDTSPEMDTAPDAAAATATAEAVPTKKQAPNPAAPAARSQAALRARKKKGRKKRKKDELLQEIFSEVFTEEGKVKEEITAQSTPAAPAAPTANDSTAAAGVAPAVAPTPAAGAIPPQPPQYGGAMPGQGQPAGQGQSAAQAAGAFAGMGGGSMPHPRPKPRVAAKSSRGGSFLSDIDWKSPMVLGGAGGGIVALVLGLWMAGLISIPGLGPNVSSFLSSAYADYQSLAASGTIPPDEWKELNSRVEREGRKIIVYLSQDTQPSERENKQRWAAMKLIELTRTAPDDTEKQKKIVAEYEKVMGR